MTTYAFLLDIARCIGCQACVAACNTGNEAYPGAAAIQIIERTAGDFPALRGWFINHRCYHCTDAPCVNHCPVDALYKEDGLTRLDRHKCIACERCVEMCPYDIPHIVRGRSFKCDGCNNLVKAGGTPWCVKTCPTHALDYGARADILAEAYRRVETYRGRYPNAQVVGDSAEFDLGVILVLPDAPEVIGMPIPPARAVRTTARTVPQVPGQAASPSFSGWSVLVGALAAIIARRNQVGNHVGPSTS